MSRLIAALKDPRVHGLVSLTHVEVSRDLGHAKVYVSVLDGTADARAVMEGLKSASGYLRRELAAEMSLRATPRLQFIMDDSLAQGAHIYQLLHEITSENEEFNDDE